MTEEQVFLGALDVADPADRTAYLEKACGGDAELRRQVDELLAAHFKTGEFLEVPVGEQMEAASAATIHESAVNLRANPGGDTVADLKKPDEALDDLHFLQPSTRPDSLGRIGHYEVLEVLGRGGFGIVFRAFDEVLHRVVAIKVLAPQLAATSPARKRFLREARSSAAVRHENVVNVYAVEDQPLPYLVMEFIAGETLQQRLDRTGPLDVTEAVLIGRQIALGLAAAHAQGLIHRDIKPGNILLEACPHPRARITDFGLARAADDASLSQSGLLAGTPMYMSPEQAKGETLDHRTDLFSLGSVLYTMLTGRPPFRAASIVAVLKRVADDTPRPIRESIPEVPEWLCAIVARLHAKNPEDRPAAAQEVADLLASGLQERLAEDTPAAISRRVRPRFAGRRWLAAASVLLALLAGLGLAQTSGIADVRGLVIRLFSPDGTLVVEVDDPGVTVRIDGSDMVITGTGLKELHVRPGAYRVVASKDGRIVQQDLVTVERNGRRLIRVAREATAVAAKGTSESSERPSGKPAAEVLAAPVPREITNSLGMKLVLIPAGSFDMGSPDTDPDARAGEKPQHPVRITRAFYLGTTEVTVGQFRRFVETTGYRTEAETDGKGGQVWNNAKRTWEYDPKLTWRSPGFPQTDEHPVVQVSWNDARAFCDALSVLDGLKPFSHLSARGPWDGEGYRLPTEAEWEYACRAGSTTRYSFGDDAASLGEFAWHDGNSDRKTHSVGQKQPNVFGLHDMHGNVWEHCWDGYEADYYQKSPAADPLGRSKAADRVRRGGGWHDDPRRCRSAGRRWGSPGLRDGGLSFRVARVQSGG